MRAYRRLDPGAGYSGEVVANCARLILALVFAFGVAAAEDEVARDDRGQVVDLTWPFDETTIYWPTEEGFVREFGTAGPTERGYYYEAHAFRAAEHGGTHIDAPIHFFAGRDHVDEIPLDRLMGPGVVVDVSTASLADPDHLVTKAEFEAWEARNGRIPDGAIVLVRTGFGRYWPDRSRYLGTSERGPGAVSNLHFPGLSAEAAGWLVGKRRIRAVGIDTASIDRGQSSLYEAHRILAEQGVPAFENVASLEALPTRNFRLIALPMKIRGGSGAPLRIIAIIPSPG